MRNYSQFRGFTLIELMITVAIIGILAAVALPSYRAYVERSHRASAKAVLLEGAQFMERQRSSNFTYAAVTLPTRLLLSPSGGAKRYDVTLVSDATSFILTATPSGWTDGICGNLTLSGLGIKGQTFASADAAVTATCWNR